MEDAPATVGEARFEAHLAGLDILYYGHWVARRIGGVAAAGHVTNGDDSG